MLKIIFYELFTTSKAQNGPKIKKAQDWLKFGTFNILNMPILTLMLKMIFIKYLPPVRPNLAPKLKVPRFDTGDISNILISLLM